MKEALVRYYGEANEFNDFRNIDKTEPMDMIVSVDGKNPHLDNKKIFEKIRSKGYWVLSIDYPNDMTI